MNNNKHKNYNYIGKSIYINNSLEMSDEFLMLAQADERAANALYNQKLYNQSAYFYIQSMEKYIKSFICKKINISNEFCSNKFRSFGHSLDNAIDFLLEIVTAGREPILKNQMETQLKTNIFKNIKFSYVYNSIRYPHYNTSTGAYRLTKVSCNDCKQLQDIYSNLKKYINDAFTRL